MSLWWDRPDRDGCGNSQSRAQRLLVRVLLALRAESRRLPNAQHERARAEALADRIVLELPRSILPLGIAALFIVGVVCLMPLMRDAIAAGSQSPAAPVASVVEDGIRERGAALNDGLWTLREIVAPFAGDEARPGSQARPTPSGVGRPSESTNAPSAPPSVASAPFSRS